jgi:hypothetical protein
VLVSRDTDRHGSLLRRLGTAWCSGLKNMPCGIEITRCADKQAAAVGATRHANCLTGPPGMASMRDYKPLTATNFLGKPHAANA